MGLHVHTLTLQDWRSFDNTQLVFSPDLTVLVGPNAIGKTNTIEALQLLTAGFSFRKPSPLQLIKQGEKTARIAAELTGDGRRLDVACQISGSRRHFFSNTKPVRAQDMPRTLMSILFSPDDLSLVKGSARLRRDELDDFGKQAAVGYANLIQAYLRTLEQRNRLLKEIPVDISLLDAWDASLAVGGAALLDARLRMFRRLKEKVIPIYRQISEGEELDCFYVSTVLEDYVRDGFAHDDTTAVELKNNDYEHSILDDVHYPQKEILVKRFSEALAASRDYDLRRQQTTVGPHRDDVVFEIDGRPARSFGSQGQQRSVVLAWKMAEVELAQEIVGSTPLLLLDDVMSELDEKRRRAVVEFVKKDIQTVITTTNLGYFTDELLADAEVIHLDKQL